MSFDWLFSDEAPLPSGHRLVMVHHASGELGARRLAEAAGILGDEAAREAARKLGPYELDDEAARALGNAGAEAGENGEFPALSPSRWADAQPASTREELVGRLGEGESLAGLLLSRAQREAFLRFLARNHVKEAADLDAAKAVALARHFFFSEPLAVVVRYTPPRFASS